MCQPETNVTLLCDSTQNQCIQSNVVPSYIHTGQFGPEPFFVSFLLNFFSTFFIAKESIGLANVANRPVFPHKSMHSECAFTSFKTINMTDHTQIFTVYTINSIRYRLYYTVWSTVLAISDL